MGLIRKLKMYVDKARFGYKEFLNIKIALTDAIYTHFITTSPRYQEDKRLVKYGFKAYSQNDEDGIIEEIFNRIGTTNKYFVEFGVGNGLENNTAYLLYDGWKGAWIDADADHHVNINKKFATQRGSKLLKTKNAMITAENIEQLFDELEVPDEPDLLSIDIDGNDYWVWKAIIKYRPRAVAIEYNSIFRPPRKWVMKYNPNHIWSGTNYYGTSLKSLEILGEQKGYKLVGCNIVGVNAFFIREDLVGEHFAGPFTAENHYEPPRHSLTFRVGHPADFGPHQNI